MASTGSGSKAGQVRTDTPARWRNPAAALAAGAVIVWILVPPPPAPDLRQPDRQRRLPGPMVIAYGLLNTGGRSVMIGLTPGRGDWSRTRQHTLEGCVHGFRR